MTNCKNCNAVITTSNCIYCEYCLTLRRCTKCSRYLSDNCYGHTDDTVCISCSSRAPVHRSALNDYVHEVAFGTSSNNINFDTFLTANADDIYNAVSTSLDQYPAIKLYFRSDAYFERYTVDGALQSTTAGFQTDPVVVSSVNDLDLNNIITSFNANVENFNRRGSSWQLVYITNFSLLYAGYRPMVGSSYVPTPEALAGRQAILNIKNMHDNLCFLYSILASLHPVDRNSRPDRVHHYKRHIHELKYDGLEFP
jgi:hypothetical protein